MIVQSKRRWIVVVRHLLSSARKMQVVIFPGYEGLLV